MRRLDTTKLALGCVLAVAALLALACGSDGVIERCDDLKPCVGQVGSCDPGFSCATIGRCGAMRLCAREATDEAYHCAVQCERPVEDVLGGDCGCSVGQSAPPFIGDCSCN